MKTLGIFYVLNYYIKESSFLCKNTNYLKIKFSVFFYIMLAINTDPKIHKKATIPKIIRFHKGKYFLIHPTLNKQMKGRGITSKVNPPKQIQRAPIKFNKIDMKSPVMV